MAAEDHTESFAVSQDRAVASVDIESPLSLSTQVTDWLAARAGASSTEVTVQVLALPGRWLLRIEAGACSSSVEWSTRAEPSAADVAAAVRRWARAVGLGARTEAQRGAEARVVLTPPSATRS